MIDGRQQSPDAAQDFLSRREEITSKESREILPLAEVDAVRFRAVVSRSLETFASLGSGVPLTVEAFEEWLGRPMPEGWAERVVPGLERMRELEAKLDAIEDVLHDRSKGDGAETFGLDMFMAMTSRMPRGVVTFQRDRGFFLMYCDLTEDFDRLRGTAGSGGVFSHDMSVRLFRFDVPVVMINGRRAAGAQDSDVPLSHPGTDKYRETLLHERTHFFNKTLYRDAPAFRVEDKTPSTYAELWEMAKNARTEISGFVADIARSAALDEFVAYSTENGFPESTASRLVRNYVGGFWKTPFRFVSAKDRDAIVAGINEIGRAGAPFYYLRDASLFREALRDSTFDTAAANLRALTAGIRDIERSTEPPDVFASVRWVREFVPTKRERARQDLLADHETLALLHDHAKIAVRGGACCPRSVESGHLQAVVEESKAVRARMNLSLDAIALELPPPSTDGIARRVTVDGFSSPAEETVESNGARTAILDALDRTELIDRDVLRSLVIASTKQRAWDIDIPSTWPEVPANHPSVSAAVSALSSDWTVTVNALANASTDAVRLSFRLQSKKTDDAPIYFDVRLPTGKKEMLKKAA